MDRMQKNERIIQLGDIRADKAMMPYRTMAERAGIRSDNTELPAANLLSADMAFPIAEGIWCLGGEDPEFYRETCDDLKQLVDAKRAEDFYKELLELYRLADIDVPEPVRSIQLSTEVQLKETFAYELLADLDDIYYDLSEDEDL